MVIEICANSIASALNAQKGGADRIELCCNLEQGGLTPSPAMIRMARKMLTIEIFVLIRPRVGDFCYSDLEFELIKDEIRFCKEVGVEGVVIGILDKENRIDVERNKALVELARPLKVTFHRAFDCVENSETALETLINLKIDRVLTSGLQPTAYEGRFLLKKLIQQAGERIAILPGSGLNLKNLEGLIRTTKATEVHLSAKRLIKSYAHPLFSGECYEADVKEIRKVVDLLK